MRNIKSIKGATGGLGEQNRLLMGYKPEYYYDYTNGEGLIFEHILYDTCDFISFQALQGLKIEASEDMVTWEYVTQNTTNGSTGVTYSIGAAFRRKRYFRVTYYNTGVSYYASYLINPLNNLTDFNNVHFTTTPGLVTAETVGTGDGSDATWSLLHTPITGSLVVMLDGVATTNYTLNGAEITFTTAPGLGVVITADCRYSCAITADYTTDAIAKDANHVVDVTFTMQFGEYTP